MIRDAMKEFNDLAPYVPSSMKSKQSEIVSKTFQAVTEARKMEDPAERRKAEHNAWLYGSLSLAQIADKTHKGTTVNTGDKEPKTHTMIDNSTNTPIEVRKVNTANNGFQYVDANGRVIPADRLTPITGANYINKTVETALTAAIPEYLPNGKDKNPLYNQSIAAISTAFATMDTFGMRVQPAMKANIASQAVQKLTQANMAITPDNISKAIYMEAIKIDTTSPLVNMTTSTTLGGRQLTPASMQVQIKTVGQIKDIANRENVKPDVAAKRVEQTWENLDAKTARKIYERSPLNTNTPIWWYNLPQSEKEKLIKEK